MCVSLWKIRTLHWQENPPQSSKLCLTKKRDFFHSSFAPRCFVTAGHGQGHSFNGVSFVWEGRGRAGTIFTPSHSIHEVLGLGKWSGLKKRFFWLFIVDFYRSLGWRINFPKYHDKNRVSNFFLAVLDFLNLKGRGLRLFFSTQVSAETSLSSWECKCFLLLSHLFLSSFYPPRCFTLVSKYTTSKFAFCWNMKFEGTCWKRNSWFEGICVFEILENISSNSLINLIMESKRILVNYRKKHRSVEKEMWKKEHRRGNIIFLRKDQGVCNTHPWPWKKGTR